MSGLGVLIGAVCVMALLGTLYLALIAPNVMQRKRDLRPVKTVMYAHRGLHDESTPENSLAAFRRAVEKGYGIEWDVRSTRDGEMILYHDASALRLCGVDRMLGEMTLEEVRSLRLNGTREGIPTLAEALALVNGRVPLIVEIKHDQPLGVALAERVYGQMKEYAGPWWVESFDPRIVRWFRRHAPQIVRGQLAYDPAQLGKKRTMVETLGAHLLMHVLSRPDFVAYGCKTSRNHSFRVVRRLFHPVTVAWTVESQEESQRLRSQFDVQIFEGFEPDMDQVFDREEKEK